MFQIDKKNNIRIIQGDTAILDLHFDNYTLQKGDCVYLTIKKHLTDSEFAIQKVITAFENGGCKIQLTSSDTNLPCGEYVYDVQCSLMDGRIDTVIGPCYFHILGGVTND